MISKKALKVDVHMFYLLLVLLAILPNVIAYKSSMMYSPLITNYASLSTSTKFDFFTFYKFVFLISITLLLVSVFLYRSVVLKVPIYFNALSKWLALFMLSVALSTAFSEHAYQALLGQYNLSEGAITYCCYIMICFIASQIHYPKNKLTWIAFALLPTVVFNTVLTMCKLFQVNVLAYTFVRKLLLLPDSFKFSADSFLVGTFNQENYVSGFFSMLLAFYLGLMIIEKNKRLLSLYTLTVVFVSIVILLSKSTTGFLTILLTVILLGAYVFYAKLAHGFKKIIGFTLSFFMLALLLNTVDSAIGDESYRFLSLQQEQMNYSVGNNATVAAATTYEQFDLPVLPNREMSAFSSCAYIWEKTAVLVLDKPVIGYGLNTMIFHFPHFNLDARAGISTEQLIIDKPHNSLLSITYGLGLVGLFIFLAIVRLLLLKMRSELQQPATHNLPLFLFLVAFFVQGLTIDTNIGSFTVFWLFVGMTLTATDSTTKGYVGSH